MAASSVDPPTSFKRHLRGENKSVRTVETYLEAAQQLGDRTGKASTSTYTPVPATPMPIW